MAAVDRYPDRLALRYFKTAWTYEELLVRVKIAAASLQRVGIQRGSRVMLVLPNCPEFIVLWFASHWLGAQVVPANPLLSGPELAEIAKKCNVDTVAGLDIKLKPISKMTRATPIANLVTVSLAPHLPWFMAFPYRIGKAIKSRVDIAENTRVMSFNEFFDTTRSINLPAIDDVDQPAVLQPTGGTTGSSKVAVLTHRNLCSNVAQLHTWSGLEPGQDTFLSVLPYFHIYGATCAMLSPLVGGSTLLIQARFHPFITTKLIQKYQPSVALLVPFMIKSLNEVMRKKNLRLDSIQQCMSGASPLAEEDAREFQERTGAVILEGFGLSEASPVTHSNPADGSSRIGSIGLPLPNTDVKLVDLETGLTEVSPGEVGELAIRGPQVMQGYLDDPEETAIALRQGWLYTGDLAVMSDGWILRNRGSKKRHDHFRRSQRFPQRDRGNAPQTRVNRGLCRRRAARSQVRRTGLCLCRSRRRSLDRRKRSQRVLPPTICPATRFPKKFAWSTNCPKRSSERFGEST